jgi:hypothetical protein
MHHQVQGARLRSRDFGPKAAATSLVGSRSEIPRG